MWPKATSVKPNNVMSVCLSVLPKFLTTHNGMNTNWVPNQENSRISLEHNYVGRPDRNLYRETKTGGLYHPIRFQWIPLAWQPPGCGCHKTSSAWLLVALIGFTLWSALHLDTRPVTVRTWETRKTDSTEKHCDFIAKCVRLGGEIEDSWVVILGHLDGTSSHFEGSFCLLLQGPAIQKYLP